MYTFSTNMHESVCTWTDLMDWLHYDATQKQEGKVCPQHDEICLNLALIIT